MKKVYCFDFDGTIADTLPIIVKNLNNLLVKSGEEEISDDFLRRLREEDVKSLFKELNISPLKLIFLYYKIRREMSSDISRARCYDGMDNVLRKLKEEKSELGILTSNSKSNVVEFLKRNDLNFFDFVKTSSLYGKEKELKKLKRKGGIIFYIGDENRDIIAGKKAKIRTVAVPWGFGSKESLIRLRPDILIEEPNDLLNLSF